MECINNKLYFQHEHRFLELERTWQLMALITLKCLLFAMHLVTIKCTKKQYLPHRRLKTDTWKVSRCKKGSPWLMDPEVMKKQKASWVTSVMTRKIQWHGTYHPRTKTLKKCEYFGFGGMSIPLLENWFQKKYKIHNCRAYPERSRTKNGGEREKGKSCPQLRVEQWIVFWRWLQIL